MQTQKTEQLFCQCFMPSSSSTLSSSSNFCLICKIILKLSAVKKHYKNMSKTSLNFPSISMRHNAAALLHSSVYKRAHAIYWRNARARETMVRLISRAKIQIFAQLRREL